MTPQFANRGRWDWLADGRKDASQTNCPVCAQSTAREKRLRQQAQARGAGSVQAELEEEIKRPGLQVRLKWIGPYTYDQIQANRYGDTAGFYIAFTPPSTIQKVGRTGTSFKMRFRHPRDKAKYATWSYYLAPYDIGGVEAAIEHAIARTLMRAGEQMPEHGEPRDVLRPLGTIAITKPLPPTLLATLSKAYTSPDTAHATVKYKGKPAVPPVGYSAGPADPNVLSLAKDQLWEFDLRNP